jgi:hypothetical protein
MTGSNFFWKDGTYIDDPYDHPLCKTLWKYENLVMKLMNRIFSIQFVSAAVNE